MTHPLEAIKNLSTSFKLITKGRWYYAWIAFLLFFILIGVISYMKQFNQGLILTAMRDQVSWGLYISNFTFLVGVAAAAVLLVIPAYLLHDVDFKRAVMLGEGVAVSAVVMCLCFVMADMGGPHRGWHLIPVIGYFNWPQSMLTWDVIVLNGYLALNLLIPFYILFSHYRNRDPNPTLYVPFVILSVFWAVSIHLVTAFLYAGLVARPFWNSALLGPRFLASAFAAGPALILLALAVIRSQTSFAIEDTTIR